MENIFDCLCCIVRLDDRKAAFVEAEGIELMIIMVRCVQGFGGFGNLLTRQGETASAELCYQGLGLRYSE